MTTNKQEIVIEKFTGIRNFHADLPSFTDGGATDMRNFRINDQYKLEKRWGFAPYCDFGTTVHGFCYDKGNLAGRKRLYALCGNLLKMYDPATGQIRTVSTLNRPDPNKKVSLFFWKEHLYMLDGYEYSVLTNGNFAPVVGYRPLRYIHADPFTGIGTELEARNLLTPYMRVRYDTTEGCQVFRLPNGADNVGWVRCNGVTVSRFEVVPASPGGIGRQVTITVDVPAGRNTVEICYTISEDHRRLEITNNAMAYTYGGTEDVRVFIYGFGGGRIYYSEEAENEFDITENNGANYFREGGYFEVGIGRDPITAVIRRYDHILIHTPCETWSAEFNRGDHCYRRYLISTGTGNSTMGTAQSLGKESYSLNGQGVFRWKAASVRGEMQAECISEPVKNSLTPQRLQNAVTFADETEGELWIAEGGDVWVFRAKTQTWCRFDGIYADGFLDLDGVGFFRGSKFYRFDRSYTDDDGETIMAVWKSDICTFAKDDSRKTLTAAALTLSASEDTEATLHLHSDRESVSFSAKVPYFTVGPVRQTTFIRARLPHIQSMRAEIRCEDACKADVLSLRFFLRG